MSFGHLSDCGIDLPPSDPFEPSADYGPRAAGTAGRRSESGASGCTTGTRGSCGLCCSWESEAVLPSVASPLPVGRPAL